MDELDLFREFRGDAAPPSDDARRQASARLASAIEAERARPTWLRLVRHRAGRYAVVLAALLVATASTLFVSAPWRSSPGFLERAQAALTPPAGTVLHMKWWSTTSSTDLACTATHGPNEMWVDQTPPYKYRMVLSGSLPSPEDLEPRALICGKETGTLEFGGALDTQQRLMFEPPDRLTRVELGFYGPPDPVAMLRQAISDGNARHDGKTEVDGRTVERIRVEGPVDCPVPGCEHDPWYMYVDPETFNPVRMESPHGYAVITAGGRPVRFHTVERYVEFEYVPRTAANLALADIRAQHPDARGP